MTTMAEARSLPHHGPGSVVISDEMSSDLTSHSYTSTPASSTTNLDVPSQPLNPERQPQSIELESYIPLGCLVSGAAAIALDYPTWTEVTTVALLEKDINRRLEIATLRLLDARWIRVHAKDFEKRTILRVYLLPDDIGQVQVARTSKSLRVHLEVLLSWLCLSVMTWNGILEGPQQHFDPWAAVEEGSLFYIFNTLPSPNPQPGAIKDRITRLAISELLEDPSSLPGLKTPLYPYQARSAAAMIQREASPGLHLDPRFEERTGPDGSVYYYSPRDLIFSRSPQVYESSRGGILAETMGLGKTIICLAVILATKDHLPQIPQQHQVRSAIHKGVPRLLDIAMATAARVSIPAKAHFARLRRQRGEEMTQCIKHAEDHPPEYSIPGVPPRSNRRTQTPPPKRLTMCSGTILVVPRNLVHQWKAELRKHVSDDSNGLKVLYMDSPHAELPPSKELRVYDVILFSKPRFEKEIHDGSDKFGRNANNVNPTCQCPYIGASRTRDCTCLRVEDLYSSPLKELHWLRVIIDEGHEFSSATSNAVLVAQKFVTADRRWVVSGTPARDRLFGVEVDLAADVDDGNNLQLLEDQYGDYLRSDPSTPQSVNLSSSSIRHAALEQRKAFKQEEESGGSGAAKSIGVLATNFLQVRPWAHNETKDRRADWDDYIYRHEAYRGRTYSSFSRCLRQTLESLVVKTQPDDVERDIVLPPLTHKVVRLEPSFYDKLTANLFNLVLTGNAVTSERKDVDYLFHRSSAKPRFQLITNLRQSNFFWTGFSVDDVVSVIDHGTGYLEKEGIHCTDEDRHLLSSCLDFARFVLASPGWRSLSKYHELAVFVDGFPEDAKKPWALTDCVLEPTMIGASQLNQAQNLVNGQLFDENPLQGLAAAGEAVLKALAETTTDDDKKKSSSTNSKILQGVPSSGVNSEPLASRRHTIPSPRKPTMKAATPLRPPLSINFKSTNSDIPSESPVKSSDASPIPTITPSKISRKRKRSLDSRDLPKGSPLAIPSIVGTSSAKLSYLLDQVISLYEAEKVLIFYDGNNTAFYIAQCLDLLHIKYLIYAKSLSSQQRSKYIVAFDADNSIRVLLMDIRCGAYGLNVNKASRVFFINPVCSPSSEAQAIKRSHRIGQDKPVHVETLVLKGTIEEAIFERSKNMTRTEHLEATQLSDDRGVATIIQNARALPVSLKEGVGRAQMAGLSKPIQIFGRKGRGDTNIRGIDLDFEGEGGIGAKRRKQEPRKTPKKSKANPVRNSEATGKRTSQPLSTASVDLAGDSSWTVQAGSSLERATPGISTEGMASVPIISVASGDALGRGSIFG